MASIPAPARRPLSTELPQVAAAHSAFVAVAVVGLGIHGIAALAGSTPAFVDNWLYCGLYLLTAASCAYRSRRGDARAAWSVAAVAVVIWAAAEISFRLIAPDPHAWYPKVSQGLLFVGFALAYLTLGLLARERGARAGLGGGGGGRGGVRAAGLGGGAGVARAGRLPRRARWGDRAPPRGPPYGWGGGAGRGGLFCVEMPGDSPGPWIVF